MNKKLIVPSYWLLFIVIPAVIAGVVVIELSLSKWVLAVAIVILLIVGEHGLRVWAKIVEGK